MNAFSCIINLAASPHITRGVVVADADAAAAYFTDVVADAAAAAVSVAAVVVVVAAAAAETDVIVATIPLVACLILF